jgi:general secretion pathway protein B
MSYILEALRKAERDREQARQQPSLLARGEVTPARRRRVWPWVVAAGLLVNVAAITIALRTPGPLTPAPGPDGRTEGPGRGDDRSGMTGPPSPAARGDTGSREGGRPVPETRPDSQRDPRTEKGPVREAPEPLVSNPETVEPRIEAPGRAVPRPSETRRKDSTPSPVQPAATVAPPAGPPKPAPGATPPGPAAPPRPAVGAPLSGSASPPAGAATVTPPAAPASPAATSPPSPTAGAVQGGLRLDVHVYSEQPADRMVFINNRKYVEGQRLDGGLLLQEITPEGAVLTSGGQRIFLGR